MLERRASLWLLSTTAIWGSTFFTMQIGTRTLVRLGASEPAAALMFSSLRFVAAAILYALIAPRTLRALGRREWLSSLPLAALMVLGLGSQGLGLLDGSSTMVAFLTNLTVIFVPVYGLLFFRERFSWGLVAGALIAVAGVWTLTDPTGGAFGRAEWLGLAAAMVFGLQIQLINRLTAGRDAGAMTLALFVHCAWMCTLGTLAVPGGAGALAPSFVARAVGTFDVAWTALYLAVFGSIIAVFVFMRWQRELPASRAAIIYCLEPVFAAGFGIALAGDGAGWRLFAGGALILAANLVCELTTSRARPSRTGGPMPAAPPAA